MNKKTLILFSACFLFTCHIYPQIKFHAGFESGAIGEVKLIGSSKIPAGGGDSTGRFHYNITTKKDPCNIADTKLPPSSRWFYFLITGVKGKEIALDIDINDSKRPVYSYDGTNFKRFTASEVPREDMTITKLYERDSVYIAYFTPYTQSYLDKKIAEWLETGYADTISIGRSEHGRDMPLLIITNNNSQGKKEKKRIYIHGRVHPGETPASWHLDKMIDILTDSNDYANDLRDNAVFYILPFANPDGVWEGMSRSNGNGINLEVNWADTEDVTAKEVKNIRVFLRKLTAKGEPLDLFLNMHSQVAPHLSYWIHSAESTSEKYYRNLMLFANITINENPYFNKRDLSFSQVKSKYLEGWFWDNFKGKTLSLTFETPYTYYEKNPYGEWVTVENLGAAAMNNIYAIGDYLSLGRRDRIIADNPGGGSGVKKRKDNETVYFGDSYLISKRKGAEVKFKGELQKGIYDVYMWSAGENIKESKAGENEWKKLNKFIMKKDGKFKYVYKSKEEGEKIDAILFIKEFKPLINRDSINVQ